MPSANATPIPTLRGWWMFQNSSTSATQSGTPGTRPHGIRFSRNAAARLKTMKYGLTGCRMYWGRLIAALLATARSRA
ncbi:Uncharacterised protein [Burkholderia pseudomallei]|nr:Uncharacterised protein [Burkholderia pseudomallei]CAK0466445.1 Uncharacterised protein [Burkholderia pseudomallei]CAK0512885.1 Uncharacterised protein [Burkholderia pseudomallei]